MSWLCFVSLLWPRGTRRAFQSSPPNTGQQALHRRHQFYKYPRHHLAPGLPSQSPFVCPMRSDSDNLWEVSLSFTKTHPSKRSLSHIQVITAKLCCVCSVSGPIIRLQEGRRDIRPSGPRAKGATLPGLSINTNLNRQLDHQPLFHPNHHQPPSSPIPRPLSHLSLYLAVHQTRVISNPDTPTTLTIHAR